MPDEMDTLLATQRARLAAEEREVLIKRARGAPSLMSLFHIVLGFLCLGAAAMVGLSRASAGTGALIVVGIVNLFIGYHRLNTERLAAILALLDEERHGPKEAWIRRLQQPPRQSR